ncbi:hypothetical protein MNBD_GAMMA20-1564 [hydrothermal vent metagenome]|uniref:Uncharacterized protein n=1 Tax=hydrothermal vent metagenome TaxID=652676 RepID=A0A3B1AQN9_9ZZZZ
MEQLIREALSNSWNAVLRLKLPIVASPKATTVDENLVNSPTISGNPRLALNHFIAQPHYPRIDQSFPILEWWL